MDSIHKFKVKLALLETMLNRMKTSHARVRELKKSVQVLRALLKDSQGIRSPYGPKTAIVRFSLQ